MTIDAGRIRAAVASARGRGLGGPARDRGARAARRARHPGAAPTCSSRSSAEAAAADTSRRSAATRRRQGHLAGDPPQERRRRRDGGRQHRRDAIAAAVARHGDAAWRTRAVAGFTINEFVRYDAALGSELLLGLRWTADFGPVVTLGAGGIYTEFLARTLQARARDRDLLARRRRREADVREALGRLAAGRLATTSLRGQAAAHRARRAVVDAVERFMALARRVRRRTTSPSARSTRWSWRAAASSRSTSW